jgi:hypothetical protein
VKCRDMGMMYWLEKAEADFAAQEDREKCQFID